MDIHWFLILLDNQGFVLNTPARRQGATETCKMLDTLAKPDQMMRLVENHARVDERCKQAYAVATNIGRSLCQAVQHASGDDMELAFVTPEQAAIGFTSSSFSFNLPAPERATAAEIEGVWVLLV